MKKYPLRNWLLAGAMGAALFGCQSKPPQAPTQKNIVPCSGKNCPDAPQSDAVNKVPCREDECDEAEAGEEAMIHVIEIEQPKEENAAVETVPSVEEDNVSETVPASSESIPQNENTTTSVEATPYEPVSTVTPELQTEKAPETAEINLETPSLTEEPTSNMFDDLPSSPISENTVVLSLEDYTAK